MPQQQYDTVTLPTIPPLSRSRVMTDIQRDAVEEWKTHLAEQFMGIEWAKARDALVADGVTMADAVDHLLDAAEDLIENGWDDYL